MSAGADLPVWAALAVASLSVAGAALSLLGAVGLVRLRRFYERIHAPTLGATLGVTLLAAASVLFFSLLEGRPILRDVLLVAFLTLTTPVTLSLLARAAAFRDRLENGEDPPPEP